MFMDVNRKEDFGDGLPPGSDVYVNRISSYISTELYIKWFTENFLKHGASGKVILLSAGHRSHCSSSVLLQTAVQNNVTIVRLPDNCTHILEPLNSSFLGA
jgi:hypothetical protein